MAYFLTEPGKAAHKLISEKYKKAHFGNGMTLGKSIRGCSPSILPDIVNYTKGQIGEIKPCSAYGFGTGPTQLWSAIHLANYLRVPHSKLDGGSWGPEDWQPRDRAWSRGEPNIRFVRYPDDWCVFLTRANKRYAETLKEEIREFLLDHCGLELSTEKTQVTHVRDGFDFLGFHLETGIGRKGTYVPKIKIGQKAISNIRLRLNEAARYRPSQESIDARVQNVSAIIRGWSNYFKIAHNFSAVAGTLDNIAHWAMVKAISRKNDKSTRTVHQTFYFNRRITEMIDILLRTPQGHLFTFGFRTHVIPRQFLHLLLAQLAPERRSDQRDRVVRLQRKTERKHRRLRIGQSVDFATQSLRQFLEQSFDPPSLAVHLSDLDRRSLLPCQIRQDVNFFVAVAGFRFQLQRDPTKLQRDAGLFLLDSDPLFIHFTRFRCAFEFHFSNRVPAFQIPMVANDKRTVSSCNSRHESHHAEIPVRDQAVLLPYLFENRIEQRPLLCVTIFTRNDVANHVVFLVVQSESLTGQRTGGRVTQTLEPMFGRGKMIAVKDKCTEAGKERGLFAFQSVDDGRKVPKALGDEFAGDADLQLVDLIVHRLDGNGNAFPMLKDGLMEAFATFENDLNHEHHDGREKESLFLLPLP